MGLWEGELVFALPEAWLPGDWLSGAGQAPRLCLLGVTSLLRGHSTQAPSLWCIFLSFSS